MNVYRKEIYSSASRSPCVSHTSGNCNMEVTVGDKPAAASQLPWKTRLAISVISGVTDATRRSNGTVNRRLLSLLDLKAPPNPNPIKGVKSSDVIVDPSRNLWFRLFVPVSTSTSTSTKLPVMVFFHGGGFVYLSADNRAYDLVCRRFAFKLPAIVISVNYRLAPEHPYPAQYQDAFDVLNFLNQHASNNLPENADLSSCFLAGDSAGANIAHHVAKRVCEAQPVLPNIKVKGVVAIQPFFGGKERTESEKRLVNSHLVSVDRTDWMWRAFMGGEGNSDSDRDHEAINVSGPRAADISALDFPPTMVVVGGLDPLQDWQRNYYNWLTNSGKKAYLLEYPYVIHAFYLFPELTDSSHLIAQVTHFIHNLSIN